LKVLITDYHKTEAFPPMNCIRQEVYIRSRFHVNPLLTKIYNSELDMDWIHPWIGVGWIGLDWIGSNFLVKKFGLEDYSSLTLLS